ncbi:MAG: EamA family transporter RarD [Tannerella sp.]|jgi:chloramphenicol-sensitive protein RarD|nr:EamA family transporter RarD [Tannerella sp.]
MNNYQKGIFFALISYLSWGLLPIFWKQLETIPSVEILAHRMLWSTVFTLILCLLMKKHSFFDYFSHAKSLFRLAVTGLLLTLNWGIYIYAINSDQIVETSLGYFINPLVSIVLGMIFLGEKLNKTQLIAFMFAVAGVAYLAVNYGHFPWIAISLALTFGVYGLLKKQMNYDSMSALAVETALIAPFALAYLIFGASVAGWSPVGTDSINSQPVSIVALLLLAGLVTSLPLYWFGMAAVRIPLYSIGFFQYISPTINLFIGIFIYHEVFSADHAISFSLIWVGLALYIGDIIVKIRRRPSKGNT